MAGPGGFQNKTRLPMDVQAHGPCQKLASYVINASPAPTTDKFAATVTTVAMAGDIVRFTSGALAKTEYELLAVVGTLLELSEYLPVAPTAGDTFDLLRFTSSLTDASGAAVVAAGQLVTVPYDYIAATYPTTSQEVYTYKIGGAAGTTVATITVNYSDPVTKQILLNVAKT